MKFTIALLQILPGGDLVRNLEIGRERCREAKALGADLAVFPELWSIAGLEFPIGAAGGESWVAAAIGRDSHFVKSFAELARELSLSVAITYLEAHAPKPRNSVTIFDSSGKAVLHYSKVFICDFGEEELGKPEPDVREIGCDVHCIAGESFDVCVLKGDGGEVRVGAMICADREFPEPAGELMRNGAELIVVPNACTWDGIRTAGLKTRAFENLVGVAMANYPRPAANGGSQAYTCVSWKDGRENEMLLAQAGDGEEILLASFDLDEIRAFRQCEAWRMKYRCFGPLRSRGGGRL